MKLSSQHAVLLVSCFVFLWSGGCQSQEDTPVASSNTEETQSQDDTVAEDDADTTEVEADTEVESETGDETGSEQVDEPEAPFEIPETEYVTEERLRVHLEALAAIATANRGNRAAGTAGYAASVDYVREYLEELGLEVTLQPFSIDVYEVGDDQILTIESAPEIVVDDAGEGTAEDTTEPTDDAGEGTAEDTAEPESDASSAGLVYGEDYGLLDYCGSGDVTAPIYPVDITMPPSAESDSTSGCEGADFADFPAGAIALIQRGTCLFQTKVRKAKYAGAVAVIMFNEGQEGRLDLFGGAMEGGEDVAIPAIATTFAVGQQLYESAQAGETVVRVSTDVYEGPQTIHNVLATYPGRSGKRWVMGAHLDSVPAGPGINDNGSGVAMLLEAARHVSRAQPDLDHGVEFAFWGAEEIGLIGSLHYVRELSEEEIPSVVGNLNFDMIGSPNPGRFVYDGDQSMYQTWIVPPAGSDVIEQVFNHYFDTHDMPYAPTAFDGRSDYYGFVEAGIPSGGLFTGAEETISLRESELFDVEEGAIFDACYHQYCDDFGNVDFQMLTELSQTSIHAMMTLVAHPFFAEIERDDSVSSESESESESEARGRVELPKRVEHACHGVRRLIR